MTVAVRQAMSVMQFGQTKRYHTEVLIKEQDVAQHSFNVAWLCWVLMGGNVSGLLMTHALAHDAGERKTGDMPAPVKINLGVGPALDQMERSYMEVCGIKLPPLPLVEAEVLKLADSLDGGLFCLRELLLGNRLMADRAQGGALLNYLHYIPQVLQAVANKDAQRRGEEILNYIQGQFDELSK